MPETPQEVKDQREATTRSIVERLKASAQTYEKLTENP
jgi:hypothetical protein